MKISLPSVRHFLLGSNMKSTLTRHVLVGYLIWEIEKSLTFNSKSMSIYNWVIDLSKFGIKLGEGKEIPLSPSV